MKRLWEILKTIYKIEDLREKILITLGFIVIYRLGAHVVLPGIDPTKLESLQRQSQEGIMSLINMFSGGAFANASIFALGIMPYITASIVVQLLGLAIPSFQKLQKEGESGRRKINQITRYLTILVLLIQSPAYLTNLHFQLPPSAFLVTGFWGFTLPAIIILTTGTIFVMWLGERITERGIGNGISLLIMIGIVARFPSAFTYEFGARLSSSGGQLIAFIAEIIALFLVFVFAIALVQATRQIPVQYPKRIIGNRQYGGVRNYLPLKVNAAGVMPIIFAQALMFIPIMFAGFKTETLSRIGIAISNPTGFWYNFIEATLIIIFTYLYTAVIINPTQIAEELKKNGGFIPGIKPGKPTAEYIDSVMSKITLPGAILLALISILPAIAMMFNVTRGFAQFFGGTTLLILVGVILDTLQQIETHMLMHHYDGFVKGQRITGRTAFGISY